MSLFNKLKWILGISLVFMLIVMTNIIDRDSFQRVKNSVESIYEDRLVAKELLLEMSLLIHEKEIAFLTLDSNFYAQRSAKSSEEMEGLLVSFEDTYLVKDEKRAFDGLKLHFQKLVQLEKSAANELRDEANMKEAFKEIMQDLKELSRIQIAEGKRQVSISQKAIETVELYTQIEIYFLIALALAVQVIILYKPRDKKVQND